MTTPVARHTRKTWTNRKPKVTAGISQNGQTKTLKYMNGLAEVDFPMLLLTCGTMSRHDFNSSYLLQFCEMILMLSFGKHVSYHLLSWGVLQLHSATVDLVSNDMILYCKLLYLAKKLWVFGDPDCRLVVFNILSFQGSLCHAHLLLTSPADSSSTDLWSPSQSASEYPTHSLDLSLW